MRCMTIIIRTTQYVTRPGRGVRGRRGVLRQTSYNVMILCVSTILKQHNDESPSSTDVQRRIERRVYVTMYKSLKKMSPEMIEI